MVKMHNLYIPTSSFNHCSVDNKNIFLGLILSDIDSPEAEENAWKIVSGVTFHGGNGEHIVMEHINISQTNRDWKSFAFLNYFAGKLLGKARDHHAALSHYSTALQSLEKYDGASSQRLRLILEARIAALVIESTKGNPKTYADAHRSIRKLEDLPHVSDQYIARELASALSRQAEALFAYPNSLSNTVISHVKESVSGHSALLLSRTPL